MVRLLNLLKNGTIYNRPDLDKITSLDLSKSNLDELPKALKSLNLRDLNLSHNKLSMKLFRLYCNRLDTPENLDLSDNRITHFHVENSENEDKIFLNHRCNFRNLILKSAHLLDLDIFWLKNCRNLQLLDISNENKTRLHKNKFKDLEKLFLKPLWEEMKILILNHLDISFFPNGIFHIESLTELHISNNSLSWFPNGIECLANLEVLDVSCNELVMIPKEICKLQKLKAFIAHTNYLEEIPLVPDHLEVLDMYDNYIKIMHGLRLKDMFIDFDYNFVSLEVQDFNYENYCLMRDHYRNLYNFNDRFCKCKSPVSEYESSTSSDNDNIVLCSGQDVEEDWDKEYANCKLLKHPDITLSDHEYDGENELYINKHCDSVTYVCVSDEDKIFVDAD